MLFNPFDDYALCGGMVPTIGPFKIPEFNPFGDNSGGGSGGYEDTDENDYIFDGSTIRYYIGTKKNPRVPLTLNGNDVKYIESTAFDGTIVQKVELPDTIIQIK